MWRKLLAKRTALNPLRNLRDRDPSAYHYFLLGAFVTSWARLEMSLDYTNWVVLHLVPGGAGLAAELPRSLGQKIGLFAAAHEKLPALREFRDAGAEIVARIHSMKESRHDLIHGRGEELASGRDHTFLRLHLKGGDIRSLSQRYSQKKLLGLAKRANDLQGDAAVHMGNLGQRFGP